MKKNIIFVTLLFFNIINCKINVSIQHLDDNTKNITLNFVLNENESVFPKSINITTDSNDIKLSDWKNANQALTNKELNKDFNLNVQVTRTNEQSNSANLYVNYLENNQNKINEEKISLNFNTNLSNNPNDSEITYEAQSQDKNIVPAATDKNVNLSNIFQNLSSWTQNLVKKTHSIWTQLLLVFLLGLLMSFTPCIYPVIPITAGILQMQGSKSVMRNFALSITYAIGIAMTFACFGLAAALSGHLFGQILTHPVFVIFISAFLIYLAFSMFGFYDMYVPKFLNKSSNIKHKGSFGSAFLFGAVSGSIASPCLSPGLALLLTIVASLANKFLGFLLLFSFGIGLSVPLIIIGTFSGSINKLPKAGMWMDEVKKIFGFLLIGMSFYYLQNILPIHYMFWLIAFTLFASGISYLYSVKSYDSGALRIYKNLLGIALISSSIFVGSKAYQKTFYKEQAEAAEDIWMHDYNAAVENAKQNKKNLVIDIGASFCTLCKAIDKKIFNNQDIKNKLKDFALVKVDATHSASEPFATLRQKYNIIGVPTILIINPNTGDLLRRFEGELYDMAITDVIAELNKAK